MKKRQLMTVFAAFALGVPLACTYDIGGGRYAATESGDPDPDGGTPPGDPDAASPDAPPCDDETGDGCACDPPDSYDVSFGWPANLQLGVSMDMGREFCDIPGLWALPGGATTLSAYLKPIFSVNAESEDCKAEADLKVGAEMGMELCGLGDVIAVDIDLHGDESRCKDCPDGATQEVCTDLICRTTKVSGNAEINKVRRYEWRLKDLLRGTALGRIWDDNNLANPRLETVITFGLAAENLRGEVTAAGPGENTCGGNCVDCTEIGGRLKPQASVEFKVIDEQFAWLQVFGKLDISGSIGARFKSGECGNQDCLIGAINGSGTFGVRIDTAALGLDLGSVDAGYRCTIEYVDDECAGPGEIDVECEGPIL